MAAVDTEQIKQVIESGMAQAQELMQDPAKVEDLLSQLQAKVKELPAEAGSALKNIPLMAQMVKGYVTRQYTDVSPKVVASLVSAFLYIVTGKDLIPDSIPVLGLVDDVAVVALVMKLNEKELAAFKEWQDSQLPASSTSAEA